MAGKKKLHNTWVTEFVNNLKGELESTFKDEISVYFDINPHDGLLETHDVNASLKEKLKCLVFIPVISRTYCDPKSFAWEHQFCAFNKTYYPDQVNKIVNAIKIKLLGAAKEAVLKKYTDNPEAYQLYLQGRFLTIIQKR